MIAPTPQVYTSNPPPSELVFELRDLFNEHPFLRYRGPETISHALRVLQGIEADVFVVERVLEVLRDAETGEVLG